MRRTLLLLAAALAACNTGFEPQYRVRDVRILDLRSHVQGSTRAADVQPGGTLDLAALVANPLARPGLSVEFVACFPQPSQATSPCLDEAYLQDPARLVAGAGTLPGVVALGPGACSPVAVSAECAVSVPVPSSPDVIAALEFAIALAKQNSTYECRLYAPLVVVAIATAAGHQSVAYKTIPILPPATLVSTAGVTDRYTPNDNPAVGDLRLNPADPDACTGGTSIPLPPAPPGPFPAGEVVLCALGDNVSSGPFNICEPDGSTTPSSETIDWQWYVSDGEFPDEGSGVGDARGGHVKFQRPAGGFTLWTIIRDERGGTDWATFAYTTL